MKKESKSKLDALMSKYDQRIAEAQQKREQGEREEETFLIEFRRLRKEVIRPVMEDIGNQLRKDNHEFRIFEREESEESEGRQRDAHITMNVYPKDINRGDFGSTSTPFIRFYAEKYKERISIYGSSIIPGWGGESTDYGEFETMKVTIDVVESKILEVLERIFKRS